jgi:hypothetical protein
LGILISIYVFIISIVKRRGRVTTFHTTDAPEEVELLVLKIVSELSTAYGAC